MLHPIDSEPLSVAEFVTMDIPDATKVVVEAIQDIRDRRLQGIKALTPGDKWYAGLRENWYAVVDEVSLTASLVSGGYTLHKLLSGFVTCPCRP